MTEWYFGFPQAEKRNSKRVMRRMRHHVCLRIFNKLKISLLNQKSRLFSYSRKPRCTVKGRVFTVKPPGGPVDTDYQ
jgi:hypothetical protein